MHNYRPTFKLTKIAQAILFTLHARQRNFDTTALYTNGKNSKVGINNDNK